MRSRAVAGLAVLVTACGGGERPAPAAPPVEQQPLPAPPPPAAVPSEVLMRGTVRLQPPMFRSCDGSVFAELVDSTGTGLTPAFSVTRATEQDGLYVLARGAFGDRRQVILRSVEYAGRPDDPDGCNDPEPSYLTTARGEDPAWQVRVLTTGVEVTLEGQPGPLSLPPASARDSAGGTVYEAASAAPEQHSLRLIVTPGGCAQNNRIYGALQATVSVDGRDLTGCAWRGAIK